MTLASGMGSTKPRDAVPARAAESTRPAPASRPGLPGFEAAVRQTMPASSGAGEQLAMRLLEGLEAYRRLLLRWAPVHNLVGSTDPAAVDAHLLDCLSAAACWHGLVSGVAHLEAGDADRGVTGLESVARIVDVGTGAGLPGVVLSLTQPGLRVELVEPNRKKAAFLQTVVGELQLSNVGVHACRIQELPPFQSDRPATAPVTAAPSPVPLHSVFTSRAFAALSLFASSCTRCAAVGDELLSMKSMSIDDEIAAFERSASGWRLLSTIPYTVPVSGVRHQLVRCARI